MDPSCPLPLQTDDETRVLASLLDVFHPFFSLEDIASAYCRAGNDLSKASDLLCQLQENNSHTLHHGNENEMTSQSEELSREVNVDDLSHFYDSGGSKPKKLSATLGSISSVLGKAYARSTASKKELVQATKPLKLEVKKSSLDDLGTEFVKPEKHLNHKDTEEFLFSMLGDGFKLNMDVIQEVLGNCGYDVKKSMEELLLLSEKALDKGKNIENDVSKECSGMPTNSGFCLPADVCNISPLITREATEPSRFTKDRSDISKELLVSLFSAPDRFEEEPKKRLGLGTRVAGQRVVTKPFDISDFAPRREVPKLQADNNEQDEVDNYLILRQSAKEHWDKMKQCYEAAIEAYSSGDHAKANNLIEEGRCHNQMAREADEKSCMEIVEEKKTDRKDYLRLDLSDDTAKDAIRLLKTHLVTLANIPTFRYLKVIVHTDAEDTTKGKRKKMVIKLLERESIKWTEEEGNPGTIFIDWNEINKSELSFSK